MEIIKKDEIINFNGYRYKCLVNEIRIPRIISKQYLFLLCCDGKIKELEED
jgi:hypothetical protein